MYQSLILTGLHRSFQLDLHGYQVQYVVWPFHRKPKGRGPSAFWLSLVYVDKDTYIVVLYLSANPSVSGTQYEHTNPRCWRPASADLSLVGFESTQFVKYSVKVRM